MLDLIVCNTYTNTLFTIHFSAHGQTQVSKKYSHQGSSKCNNCSNYHRILSYFVNIYWEHLFCTKSSQYWCQKKLENFMMYPIHQSWLKLFIAWLGKLTMLNSVLYRQSQSRREHNVRFYFHSEAYCTAFITEWIEFGPYFQCVYILIAPDIPNSNSHYSLNCHSTSLFQNKLKIAVLRPSPPPFKKCFSLFRSA